MANRDFFISYTGTDKKWAEWVGWALEDNGYSVFLQAWDIAAGRNFILEMDRAAQESERTIAVMSRSYLASTYAQPEWAQSFAKDPTGSHGLVVPVRVESCNFEGILKPVVWIDLVDTDETQALQRLLEGVKRERAKPASPPPFPGMEEHEPQFLRRPIYPPAEKTFDRRKLSPTDAGTLSINLGESFLDGLPAFLAANPKYQSIAFFDIDGQGGINRRFTTHVGDKVIQRVSQILDRELLGSDTFHRCGDDTFFALLPHSLGRALSEAKRLIDNIKHYSSWSDLAPGLHVTCSGAVCEFPSRPTRTEQSIDETVLRAAIGCRSARLKGGDRVQEGPLALTPEDEVMKTIALSRRVRNIHSGGV